MDKRLIETKKAGICIFDYFCIDSTANPIPLLQIIKAEGQSCVA